MYFRENRQGVEKVHDIVEKTLLTEVKNIRNAQEKLKQCLEQVNEIHKKIFHRNVIDSRFFHNENFIRSLLSDQ